MPRLSFIENRIADLAERHVMERVVKAVDVANPPKDFVQSKILVVVGGGRGSGKSDMREMAIDMFKDSGIRREYVGEIGSHIFDDVFKLPGIKHLRKAFDSRAKDVAVGVESSTFSRVGQELFARARSQVFKQGSPLVIDYHMDDPKLVQTLVAEAREHGYETLFSGVTVTPETARERIAARERITDRRTDLGEAMNTHTKFSKELPSYFELFDTGMLFENNGKAPRLIASSKSGELTILDGEAYERVRQVAARETTHSANAGREANQHHTGSLAGGSATGKGSGERTTAQAEQFAERLSDRIVTRDAPNR